MLGWALALFLSEVIAQSLGLISANNFLTDIFITHSYHKKSISLSATRGEANILTLSPKANAPVFLYLLYEN